MINHKDPLIVLDRHREPTTALRDMLAGRPAFLVCGGPSAKALPLDLLAKRGVWSLGVNNMAGYAPVNAFVCSDPPQKFSHGIWLDPQVMKFVPTPKLTSGRRGNLRSKIGDTFDELQQDGRKITVLDCPNVWGFSRSAWWDYGDTFFTDESATWGNANSGVDRTGNAKVMCTMLLGIRLLYHLGARVVYLVGVDFMMSDAGYAFGQGRTVSAVNSNNDQYKVVNRGLCTMAENGVFHRFGLDIFNCCPQSGLRAFPHVPFEIAIKMMLNGFPPEPLDLTGWYEKGQQITDPVIVEDARE